MFSTNRITYFYRRYNGNNEYRRQAGRQAGKSSRIYDTIPNCISQRFFRNRRINIIIIVIITMVISLDWERGVFRWIDGWFYFMSVYYLFPFRFFHSFFFFFFK